MLAPQNSNPAAAAIMDHRHCIDFSLPLHCRSIQPIMHYFEVVKKCFLLSLISIYCSLSIQFNCSWNFVSLWLWVTLNLSFFVFVFMEFVVVGCSKFKFFHFFSLQISTFSSSSFVVKSMAKKNHEIFVIRFSFSIFFVCNFFLDFWFLGILLFGFNSGFVLVDI